MFENPITKLFEQDIGTLKRSLSTKTRRFSRISEIALVTHRDKTNCSVAPLPSVSTTSLQSLRQRFILALCGGFCVPADRPSYSCYYYNVNMPILSPCGSWTWFAIDVSLLLPFLMLWLLLLMLYVPGNLRHCLVKVEVRRELGIRHYYCFESLFLPVPCGSWTIEKILQRNRRAVSRILSEEEQIVDAAVVKQQDEESFIQFSVIHS